VVELCPLTWKTAWTHPSKLGKGDLIVTAAGSVTESSAEVLPKHACGQSLMTVASDWLGSSLTAVGTPTKPWN
jgi:hypothetical protein